MLCPLLKTKCIKKNCVLFIPTFGEGQCSITIIAETAININAEIIEQIIKSNK